MTPAKGGDTRNPTEAPRKTMLEFLPVMSMFSASHENPEANWNERKKPVMPTPAKSPGTDQLPTESIKIIPAKQNPIETKIIILGWRYLEMMTPENLPAMKQTKYVFWSPEALLGIILSGPQ